MRVPGKGRNLACLLTAFAQQPICWLRYWSEVQWGGDLILLLNLTLILTLTLSACKLGDLGVVIKHKSPIFTICEMGMIRELLH